MVGSAAELAVESGEDSEDRLKLSHHQLRPLRRTGPQQQEVQTLASLEVRSIMALYDQTWASHHPK